MIICTNDDVLRTFAECSAWEKLCLKERLWQGCDFTYDLSAKEQDYVESFGCSADEVQEERVEDMEYYIGRKVAHEW